ncbi:MAG: ABC transporter permease [Thermoleophilia bacterium]|nr:ABC transporter permease [Thermoleophilia bacterium]
MRDRSAILVAIVVPLALAYIFSLVLSGVTGGSMTFTYAVVDRDNGPLAHTFTGVVLKEIERQGLIEVRREDSVETARALAASGEIDAAFIIPEGFSGGVQAGGPAMLEVIGNIDAAIGTQVARSLAESFVAELTAVRVGVASVFLAGGADEGETAALAARAAAVPNPVLLEDVSAASRELDPDTFYAAGMAVFFLFFTVQFGVSSLLEERNEGTLSRLVAAPISRSAILGGKLLTSFLLGAVSMTVLILATMLLMGALWGNPLGVGLLVAAGVMAAVGIMGVVATFARNAEQAGQWQSVIAVVLGLLGGTFFPVSQAGGVIEKLSLLTPHSWFLRGLGDLAGGVGPAGVLPATGAMLAFAAVTGGIALIRLRKLTEL